MFKLLQYRDNEQRDSLDVRKYFGKKDDACAFSAEHGCLPIFSIDKNDSGGSKFFLVTSYKTFFKFYGKITRPEGHFHASDGMKILPFA